MAETTDGAVPRLAPLPAADRTEEQRRLIDEVRSEKHIFTTLVRNPGLFEPFLRFGGRLLFRSGLPDQVRETLILRTAYRCRADYEWVEHVQIAQQAGLPAEIIAQLDRDEPGPVDAHTALLISAADQLTMRRDLDDPTWAALREHYDEQQLIELCMLVGNYAMLAGTLKALRVPLEDGQSAPQWQP